MNGQDDCPLAMIIKLNYVVMSDGNLFFFHDVFLLKWWVNLYITTIKF